MAEEPYSSMIHEGAGAFILRPWTQTFGKQMTPYAERITIKVKVELNITIIQYEVKTVSANGKTWVQAVYKKHKNILCLCNIAVSSTKAAV